MTPDDLEAIRQRVEKYGYGSSSMARDYCTDVETLLSHIAAQDKELAEIRSLVEPLGWELPPVQAVMGLIMERIELESQIHTQAAELERCRGALEECHPLIKDMAEKVQVGYGFKTTGLIDFKPDPEMGDPPNIGSYTYHCPWATSALEKIEALLPALSPPAATASCPCSIPHPPHDHCGGIPFPAATDADGGKGAQQ